MAISVFDLFTIGIGPSSSHTVGPMRAAAMFIDDLTVADGLPRVAAVRVELYGSLGATGRGHGTHKAVVLGLEGETPEGVDVDSIPRRMSRLAEEKRLTLGGAHGIDFDVEQDLRFEKRKKLPGHPNGMRFTALDENDGEVLQRIFYSVGGGFVIDEDHTDEPVLVEQQVEQPYPFDSGAELLALC